MLFYSSKNKGAIDKWDNLNAIYYFRGPIIIHCKSLHLVIILILIFLNDKVQISFKLSIVVAREIFK